MASGFGPAPPSVFLITTASTSGVVQGLRGTVSSSAMPGLAESGPVVPFLSDIRAPLQQSFEFMRATHSAVRHGVKYSSTRCELKAMFPTNAGHPLPIDDQDLDDLNEE